MATGTYTDPDTNEKLQFSVPDNKKNDENYISIAIKLAKENKKPIIGAPVESEGFGGGLLKSSEGILQSLPHMIPGYDLINDIPQAISDIKNINDPNYRASRVAEGREVLRNAPGVADFNRIKAGDYSGEIGELTPQIIATILGASPGLRAGISEGAAAGTKAFMNTPVKTPWRSPLGLAGIGIGRLLHPGYEGELIGGAVGSITPNILKGAAEGGKRFLRGFLKSPTPEPLLAEDVSSNVHPFQYSGNSVSRRLASPQGSQTFNMGPVGGFEYKQPEPQYNPRQIASPEQINTPEQNLRPHVLQLPPSAIWDETLQKPNISRGAIPLGGVNVKGSKIGPSGKVISRATKYNPSGAVEDIVKPKNRPVKPIKSTKTEPIKSKSGEVKQNVSTKTENPQKTESETNKAKIAEDAPSKENSITSPVAASPEGEDKYVSMSDAGVLSQNLDLPYNEVLKHLKSEGYQVISDWEIGKKKLGTYGLNIKGKSINPK